MNTWDEPKRQDTLQYRGLDFAEAEQVFSETHVTIPDERTDYGEPRFLTMGYLRGRLIVVIWTPRDGSRRIISMRKANGREEARFHNRMD